MCYTGFMIVNNRGSSHFKVCVRCNWMEINLCTPVGLRILLLGTQLSLWHLFKQHRSVSSKYWKIFFLGPSPFYVLHCTSTNSSSTPPLTKQKLILIVPYSPVRRRSKLESIEQSESNNNNNNNVDLHFFFKHYFILPERKGPFDLPKLINLHSTNLISW